MRRWLGAWVLVSLVTVPPSPAAEAPPHLTILSDSDCPSGQAVAEALWAIRPDLEWPILTATISTVGHAVQITLGEEADQRRELAVPDDCAERVNRVALIIAVWSSRLPAHDTRAPRLAVVAPSPSPKKVSTRVTELGIDGFYAMVDGLAPGARVSLGQFQRDGRWGARATVGYQSAKARRVNIGESRYDRTVLGATVAGRWDRPLVFLASEGGVLGAFTRASGSGYSLNQSATGLNLAFSVDGRVGLRRGAFRLWASVSVYRWLREETIQVDFTTSVAPSVSVLPRWDAHLGLGTSLAFD